MILIIFIPESLGQNCTSHRIQWGDSPVGLARYLSELRSLLFEIPLLNFWDSWYFCSLCALLVKLQHWKELIGKTIWSLEPKDKNLTSSLQDLPSCSFLLEWEKPWIRRLGILERMGDSGIFIFSYVKWQYLKWICKCPFVIIITSYFIFISDCYKISNSLEHFSL